MFFTQMNQFMTAGVDYNLTLSKNENGMTILVMPRVNDLKDTAQHHLPPLTLSGTPEELDLHFMSAVAQPVQRAAGVLSSMAQFERQTEKAAAESKAAKEQRDKESKEVREKREKYEKFVKKSEELEESGNFVAAIDNLRQARLHATEESAKSVDAKIAALRTKMNEGTLFGEQTPQPQSPSYTQMPARPNPQPQIMHPPQQPAPADPFGQTPSMSAGGAYMREHPMTSAAQNDIPTCREDEYSSYPDFPRELTAQPIYNPQMF